MEQKKVKIINIYLTNQDRKRLNEIKYKYHLSYSTIAEIVSKTLTGELKTSDLKTKIYEDKYKYKTSIKPRNWYEYEDRKTIFENTLKIYLRGDLIKYMNEEKATKIELKIINEMKEKYDENWNGNNLNRQIPKILKKNREYCKKLLELE